MSFFKLLSLLPFRLLYILSDFLYILIYNIIGYRKKIVQQNLANSFPKKNKIERKIIEKQFYKHFCDLIVETIKLLTISEKVFLERTALGNIDLPLSYLKKGQSITVLCGHTGNWEWLLQACCAQSTFPVDAVYKPLSSTFFDKLMLKIRSRFGAIPVKMKDVPRSVIKQKGIIHAISMVADQTPPKAEIQFTNTFLHQKTPWYVGAEKIAHLADMPVFYAGMTKSKRGFYEIYFELIAEPPYLKTDTAFPVIQKFAEKLEENIEQMPSLWLWSHRRWKYA